MNKLMLGAAAMALATGTAHAGGLDRTYQPIGIIFEEGNYFEFSMARTMPDLNGTGVGVGALPAGSPYSDAANDFNLLGAGFKMDIDERLSFAMLFEQPYGADVFYGGLPGATELGGTSAQADTDMLTGILRYRFDDNFSVYGGLRVNRAEGDITLSGLAYGGLSRYNVNLAADTATGYLLGAAYEVPEIALRVALTYNSAITHDFDTVETNVPISATPVTSTTEVDLPQSIALDFQSGVAPRTLVFGQVRWSEWSAFRVNPLGFDSTPGTPPEGLASLEDIYTYTLGVGYSFSDTLSGSISVIHEAAQDRLVSPLAPGDGFDAIAIGARYTSPNGIILSGGIRYTAINDSSPATGTVRQARADFTDNSAVSVGLKVGFRF